MSLFDKSKKLLVSSLCILALGVAGCNNGADSGGNTASKAAANYPAGNLDLVAPAGAGGG